MSHIGPATDSPIRLFSAGAPPLLMAQLSPFGAWEHVAWVMAAAAALGATVGTVTLVQHRRLSLRSRHRGLDIPLLFAPPARQPHPPAQQEAPAGPAAPTEAPAAETPPSPAAAPTASIPAAPARPAVVGPVQGRRARKRPVDEFPSDGTLQVLPGRLEVLAGIVADNAWEQEIRFICIPGTEPDVTFGRGEGPPHGHVRLASATVSREHAHMHFGRDGWTLRNLSRTNPTLVNGEPLQADLAVTLREGDRIEMGEAVFRFHER